MSNTLVPQDLVEAASERRITPLIGPGLSKQASDRLPSWWELFEQLLEQVESGGEYSAENVAEIRDLARSNPRDFLRALDVTRAALHEDDFLKTLWTEYRVDTAPARAHEVIVELNPRIVLTTNLDTLMEDAHARTYGKAAYVYTHEDADAVLRRVQSSDPSPRMIILKLFGSIGDLKGTVLSEVGYRNSAVYGTSLTALLERLFLTTHVCIFGYSPHSPELRVILNNLQPVLRFKSVPTYAFMPSPACSDEVVEEFRTDYGVDLIPFDPSEGYPEVVEFLEALVDQAFPNNAS